MLHWVPSLSVTDAEDKRLSDPRVSPTQLQVCFTCTFHFYYRKMHWISAYGKTAFKSTSLLAHMICERGKGKLVITIDFLTYSQIIAFDYKQGQLQE